MVAAGAVLAGALAAAAPAHADPTPNNGLTSDYGTSLAPQLVELNLNGGLLTNRGDSHSAGTTIDLWQRSLRNGVTQPNQVWQFLSSVPDFRGIAFESGEFGELQNLESGLCLTVPNQSTAEMTPLTQQPCAQNEAAPPKRSWPVSPNQLWKAVPSGDGYLIKAAYGVVHLGINRPTCANGFVNGDTVLTRSVWFEPCGTWKVRRVLPRGGEPIVIEAPAKAADANPSGYVIDSVNPAGAWGVEVQTKAKATPRLGSTQQWYRQLVGSVDVNASLGQHSEQVFRYVSVPDGDWSKAVCLGAQGDHPHVGTPVDTYGCDPNFAAQPNQLWLELATNWDTQVPGPDYDGYNTSGPNDAKMTLVNLGAVDLDASTYTFPVASISTTIAPVNGGRLRLEAPNSTTLPAITQAWMATEIREAPAPGGTAPVDDGRDCSFFACLMGQ